jgi:hypothetical protein
LGVIFIVLTCEKCATFPKSPFCFSGMCCLLMEEAHVSMVAFEEDPAHRERTTGANRLHMFAFIETRTSNPFTPCAHHHYSLRFL